MATVYKWRKNKDGVLYKSFSLEVGTGFCPTCRKHWEDCREPLRGNINYKVPVAHPPLDEDNYAWRKEDSDS